MRQNLAERAQEETENQVPAFIILASHDLSIVVCFLCLVSSCLFLSFTLLLYLGDKRNDWRQEQEERKVIVGAAGEDGDNRSTSNHHRSARPVTVHLPGKSLSQKWMPMMMNRYSIDQPKRQGKPLRLPYPSLPLHHHRQQPHIARMC